MELSAYYEHICKQPLLSKEEEQKLIATIFDENETKSKRQAARTKLINANLRFVFKKAKRYARGDLNQFEELIAAGNEGLIIGLDKYDHTSDVRFLTYAGWWVMQRQLKEMSQWRIVSLPMQKQQLSTRIRKFIEGREKEPTLEELKTEFPDASEKDLEELSQTQFLTFYLDDVDPLESPDINPIAFLEKQMDIDLIKEHIDSLGYPDNIIATMSFGLDDGKPKSNRYIQDAFPEPPSAKTIKEVRGRVKDILSLLFTEFENDDLTV